jgi:starch synthase
MRKTTKAFISLCLGVSLLTAGIPGGVQAQEPPFMPSPEEIVGPSEAHDPSALVGLKIVPDNPLRMDFLINAGDALQTEASLRKESLRLIQYFLAALTVPAGDQWVNLSPKESGRVIRDHFGKTRLGRDLLAQDYLLKQLTASLLSPEKDTGDAFWKTVYEKASAEWGSGEMPFDLLSKVWIVPDRAVVYQDEHHAYVVESRLKVMTDAEYQSLSQEVDRAQASHPLVARTFQEKVVPAIEHEINHGKNFSALRQMYHSVILATWFKRNLRQSILGKHYVDQNKISGIDLKDLSAKQAIYARYLNAYKQGLYEIVKENYDENHQEVVHRKYMAGGMNIGRDTDQALVVQDASQQDIFNGLVARATTLYEARVNFRAQAASPVQPPSAARGDHAMLSGAAIPAPYDSQTIKSGGEAVFRLRVDPQQAPHVMQETLRLVTNMGGAWQVYKDTLHLAHIEDDGSFVFEAKATVTVNRNHTILYTFFNENQETGQREWIGLPGEDGEIRVTAPFEGRVASISMEFGGPLGQKAGGEGDVVYGKNTEVARWTSPENAPIAIIPFFKRNMSASIVEKHDQFAWEPVEGFSFAYTFNRKGPVTLTAEKTEIEGVGVYRLVSDNDQFFQKLYSGPETEFYESILLSRGGVALLKHLQDHEGVRISVVESHDHHTSLVLPLMRGPYQDDFEKTGHVMLLHNIGYQGQYWQMEWFDEMGLPDHYMELMRQWDEINMLAISARMLGPENRAVTVSPRYVVETLRTFANLGFLVDTLLAQRPEYFQGLLNGISDTWNPAMDRVIQKYASFGFKNFDSETLHLKKDNKAALQRLFARDADNLFKEESVGYLEEGSDNFLLVSTNRLESQKQLDMIEYQVRRAQYEQRLIDFVVIGDGMYEAEMRKLARDVAADPDSTVHFVYRPFNSELERLALAGADGCIAPSDFEPGGLAHLKGMLYGAVPFVRWTGGLADTVDEEGEHPSGFGFAGVPRTFSQRHESAQVKGILSQVDWQEFIYTVDQELAVMERERGKFEAGNLELYEAVGRAFQKDGVVKLNTKQEKDRLFWDMQNGIPNGWAVTSVDTVRKAVNERQFYRAIMRGLETYEQRREYFSEVMAFNAMQIKAYWSDRIDPYFQLYQELKEVTHPDEEAEVTAEILTGEFAGTELDNAQGRMQPANGEDTSGIEPLDQPSDMAMVSDQEVGGIDLNTDDFALDVRQNGSAASDEAAFQDVGLIEINGLSPRIMALEPVYNLPVTLGMRTPPNTP